MITNLQLATAVVALLYSIAASAAPAPAAIIEIASVGPAVIRRDVDPKVQADAKRACMDKPVCPAEGTVK